MDELKLVVYFVNEYGFQILVCCTVTFVAVVTFERSARAYKKHEESWRPKHVQPYPLQSEWGAEAWGASLKSLGLLVTLVCIGWGAALAMTSDRSWQNQVDRLLLGTVLAIMAWPAALFWCKGRLKRGERRLSAVLIANAMAAYLGWRILQST